MRTTLLALIFAVILLVSDAQITLTDCQPVLQANYSNFYTVTNAVVNGNLPSTTSYYSLFAVNNSLFPWSSTTEWSTANGFAITTTGALLGYYFPDFTIPSNNEDTFSNTGRSFRINVYGSVMTLNGVPFKNLSRCPADPTRTFDGFLYELSGLSQNIAINTYPLNLSIASGLLVNASVVLSPTLLPTSLVLRNATFTAITKFASVLRSTTLASTFASTSASPSFTVFVPVDAGNWSVPTNWSDPAANNSYFLRSHVVSGSFFKAAFQGTTTVLTNLNGEKLIVRNDFNNGTFTIGYNGKQATILARSNCFSINGVIHTISTALFPQSIDPTIPANTNVVLQNGLTCNGQGYTFDFFSTVPVGSSIPTHRTLFAFGDASFGQYQDDVNGFSWSDVVSSHMLDAQVSSDAIPTSYPVTKTGYYLRLNYDSNNNLFIGGLAKVLCTDFLTRTGIVHLVDRPVVPLTSQNNITIKSFLSSNSAYSDLNNYLSLIPTLDLDNTNFSLEYTLFAPTNNAFSSLPASIFNYIDSNDEIRNRILSYHLSPKLLFPVLYPSSTAVPSLSSADSLTVQSAGFFNLQIDNATVLGPLTQRRNGVLFSTETLLIPPSLIASPIVNQMASVPSLSVFVAWIKSFPANSKVTLLLSNLNPNNFTLFGPSNSAFAALGLGENNITTLNGTAGEALFFRHMVAKDLSGADIQNDLIVQSYVEGLSYLDTSGTQWLRFNRAAASPNDWFINGKSKITTPEAASTSNSYVHIIDTVLAYITSEQNTTLGYSLEIPGNSEGFPIIFKSQVGGVNFGTNQLDNSVLGSNPFTVFTWDNATYNAEFTNKTRVALNASPSMFQSLIRNHIINFTYFSTTINTATIKTLAGNSYVVTVLPGGILSFDNGRINATVKSADVIRRNGVAHMINKVLWPAEVKVYVSTYGDPLPTPTPFTPTPVRRTPTPTPFNPNVTPTPTPTPTDGVPVDEPTPTPTPTSASYDRLAASIFVSIALFLVIFAL